MGAGPQPNFIQFAEAVPFTPTITFGTPGDLSVNYTTQVGKYWITGNILCFYVQLVFVPTYTTAASTFEVSSPPIVPGDSSLALWFLPVGKFQTLVWPGGTAATQINAIVGNVFTTIQGTRSNGAGANFTVTQVVSGGTYTLNYSGCYGI